MKNLTNSKSEGIILILSDLLKQLSEKNNISEAFKEYYLLENTYVGLIKKQHFGSVITQNKLYSLMKNYYYQSNNVGIIKDRRIAEKKIKETFYSFLLSPSFAKIIGKLYSDESESMYELDKYSIIKGIHKTFYDKIIKTIYNTTSYNTIPNFIIYYDKKLLYSKINDIIKHQYLFNYTDKNQDKLEYKYLMKYFQIFSKNPNIVFDKDIFTEEFRIKLFKLIVLCNYKYLKINKIAYKQFNERIINYMILLKLGEHINKLNEEFNLIMKKEQKIIDEDLKILIENIKDELFPVKNSNLKINNIKNDESNKININNNENENKSKLNKKFLKLIFSLSVLFNRIIIIKSINNENKHKDDNKEENNKISININNINMNEDNNENIININNNKYEIKIISKLKCSSINRQFLLNILKVFEDEKSFIYNYMLDTYIYDEIIKKYTRNLFQKTRAKEKIIITYEEILEMIRQKESISEFFNNFYNENKSIFSQPKLTIGFIGNLFNKKIPNSIKTETGKELYYNINELKLIPIIKGDINSTQITIIIDGPLSTDIKLSSDTKELSHKDIFCSFFTNNIYTNSDFYLYDWQTINYNELSRIKKISKFFGKLLAYILVSREIFKFQTINLVGYSMGCNVIKYCLIEMNKINKNLNCDEIINNVVLICGSINLKTDKYPDIFDRIAGKIINIFSKVDSDLIQYNKNSIGLKELLISDKYQIINVDLSKKNIKQNEYLYQIPSILFQNNYLH